MVVVCVTDFKQTSFMVLFLLFIFLPGCLLLCVFALPFLFKNYYLTLTSDVEGRKMAKAQVLHLRPFYNFECLKDKSVCLVFPLIDYFLKHLLLFNL